MSSAEPLAARQFLERLRLAGYRRLGRPLPDYSPKAIAARDAASMAALAPGGEIERDLVAHGLTPAQAAALVARNRAAMAQIDRHHTPLPAGTPSAGVDPRIAGILADTQAQVESLAEPGAPSLPGRLHALRGHVIADLLPTGEMNARAFRIPRSDAYAIAFEPVFFDFFYHATCAIADALDPLGARRAARRFALGEAVSIAEPIRWGDAAPLHAFLSMLEAFLLEGHPPAVLAPYREDSFDLAETMRRTGMLFVTAHEYAHILLGHVEGQATHQASWEQELEADHLGWRMTDTVFDRMGVPAAIRALGAQAFLACCAVLALARDAIAQGSGGSILDLVPAASHAGGDEDARAQVEALRGTTGLSHPPLRLRLTSFNRMLRLGRPALAWREAEFFSMLIFEVAGQFWMRMQPFLLRRHEQGARLAPSWEGWDSFVAEAAGETPA